MAQRQNSPEKGRPNSRLQLTSGSKPGSLTTPSNKEWKRQLPLPSAQSKEYAAAWRTSLTYLSGCLPKGSLSLITPRQFGVYIGTPCICEVRDPKGEACGAVPPSYLKTTAQKWRWLSFHKNSHLAGAKPKGRVIEGKLIRKSK